MGLIPGEPWFVPKRFGYGASPATWQGWLATAGFIALFVLVVTRCRGALRWGGAIILIAAFIALVYTKTSAEWRWRWGKD
jgi:hypothetical protein